MNRPILCAALVLLACLAGCAASPHAGDEPTSLAGAWRSHVQFATGDFASIKDLEFLYTFNRGGTMTESSNYDGAPPVPPAYGIWRAVGPGRYEATYIFYTTKPPENFDQIAHGAGWAPAGRGRLTERLDLAPDGRTFDSTITLELFDTAGKPAGETAQAKGHGTRIEF